MTHEILISDFSGEDLTPFLEAESTRLAADHQIRLQENRMRGADGIGSFLAFIPQTFEAVFNFIVALKNYSLSKKQSDKVFVIKIDEQQEISLPATMSADDIGKVVDMIASKKIYSITLK